MSVHSNVKRIALSAFGAVLMSSVAVGSAVAPGYVPGHVSAAPTKYVTHA